MTPPEQRVLVRVSFHFSSQESHEIRADRLERARRTFTEHSAQLSSTETYRKENGTEVWEFLVWIAFSVIVFQKSTFESQLIRSYPRGCGAAEVIEV